MNPGRRRGGLGLFLLATQIINIGIDNIPPVTLASVALQVAIFLGLGDLGRWFYSAQSVCINSFKVWYQSQWNVLILSALYHADDFHLYYNMVSFLWKGRILERKFKSVYFAYLLAVFTILTSIMYVGINMLLARISDESYLLQCAVGFSGVIFALKVLVSYYSPPGQQLLMGFIPVPSRMIFWAELILIQFITPNASFTGHLAGILVGLLYIKGPLKMIMDSFIQPGPSYTYTNRTSGYRTQQNYYSDNQGYTFWGNRRHNDYNNHYTGGLSEEEQLRRATQESLRDNRNTNRRGLYPDLDDLRARRQNRFQ